MENPPSKEHKLAFDIVVDRISGFVGNYFVKLDGQVDALVFAGGIGEKSSLLRKRVVEQCKCLGFAVDEAANGKGPESEQQTVIDISKDNAKTPRVLICQTNEQVSPHCGRFLPSSPLPETSVANKLPSMKWPSIVSTGSLNRKQDIAANRN